MNDDFENIYSHWIFYNIFNNYKMDSDYFYISHKNKTGNVYYKMFIENINETNIKNDIIKSIIREKHWIITDNKNKDKDSVE